RGVPVCRAGARPGQRHHVHLLPVLTPEPGAAVNITRLAVNGLRLLAGKPRDTGRAARTLPRGRRRKAAVAASVGLAAFALFQLGLAVAAELSFWVRDPGYSDKEIRLARLEAAAPG